MQQPTAWDIAANLSVTYKDKLEARKGKRISRDEFLGVAKRKRLETSFKVDVQDACLDFGLIIGIGKNFVVIALDDE